MGFLLSEFLTASQLLEVLRYHGFSGKGFNVTEVGKACRRIGFERRKFHNLFKFLVVRESGDMLQQQGKDQARTYLEAQVPPPPQQQEMAL